MKIAIFYHCLFYIGQPTELSTHAVEIVYGQMQQLRECGLLDIASEFQVGINGEKESLDVARLVIPGNTRTVLHGLDSRCENPTILMIEQWLPGHAGWLVLYFHSKGATHQANKDEWKVNWGKCMFRNTVKEWKRCLADLNAGYESVGCHWMTGKQTPPGQSIWAGNFWWATSDFLLTLPSIMVRDRIKQSGLKHVDSRYESEVWIGNGPRLPRIKDYHPDWNPSKISTCVP